MAQALSTFILHDLDEWVSNCVKVEEFLWASAVGLEGGAAEYMTPPCPLQPDPHLLFLYLELWHKILIENI